jgi:hypothetical protein
MKAKSKDVTKPDVNFRHYGTQHVQVSINGKWSDIECLTLEHFNKSYEPVAEEKKPTK